MGKENRKFYVQQLYTMYTLYIQLPNNQPACDYSKSKLKAATLLKCVKVLCQMIVFDCYCSQQLSK